MVNKWWVVLPIFFFITGCSTVSSRRISNLENKVAFLEEKVNTVEKRQLTVKNLSQDSVAQTVVLPFAETNVFTSRESLTFKDIQTALKNAGFYNSPIDGKIGPKTKKAIREFQKANSLKSDGIVGEKTKSLLIKYLAQEDR